MDRFLERSNSGDVTPVAAEAAGAPKPGIAFSASSAFGPDASQSSTSLSEKHDDFSRALSGVIRCGCGESRVRTLVADEGGLVESDFTDVRAFRQPHRHSLLVPCISSTSTSPARPKSEASAAANGEADGTVREARDSLAYAPEVFRSEHRSFLTDISEHTDGERRGLVPIRRCLTMCLFGTFPMPPLMRRSRRHAPKTNGPRSVAPTAFWPHRRCIHGTLRARLRLFWHPGMPTNNAHR